LVIAVVKSTLRQMAIGGILLALFAIIGTSLVATTYQFTHETIIANERAALLASLRLLISADRHTNAIETDRIVVSDPRLDTQQPVEVYRARHHDQPVAIVIGSVAPDGYSGRIQLLVGINYDGTLSGVRVISHRETPGLGDDIEIERSPWILAFSGRSLFNPPAELWRVKKDGGIFDQFTGATITPRAVVHAVRRSLDYYQQHRDQLFALPADGASNE
jgi:Na+-translocating ferredoxin:NAD+ oxidoreductase subunit G